jgi:hypothetical protein
MVLWDILIRYVLTCAKKNILYHIFIKLVEDVIWGNNEIEKYAFK